MTDKQCNGKLSSVDSYIYGQPRCTKQGLVYRNGKWYCGTHDPVRVAERQKKSDEDWREERAEIVIRRNNIRIRHEAGEMGIALAEWIMSKREAPWSLQEAWIEAMKKATAILVKIAG